MPDFAQLRIAFVQKNTLQRYSSQVVMSEATHTATKETLEAQRVQVDARKPEEVEKEKKAAVSKVTELQAQQAKAASEKRDKLLAVTIDRAEAATLALEFGIAKETAETVLREQGGNLEAAFTYLLATKPVRAH